MIPFADYCAIDAINISTLLHMGASAKQCKHVMDNGTGDTATLALGRAIHSAVLEPVAFAQTVVTFPGRRSGKKWDAFQVEHAGKTIISEKDLETATNVALSVRQNPIARNYLAKGKVEHTLQWAQEGHACKGRVDFLTDDDVLIDVKSARDITPGGFGRSVAKYHYNTKMAWYRHAIAEAMGRQVRRCVFIAVQSVEPFDIAIETLTEWQLASGDDHWQSLFAEWSECKRTDRWPGHGDVERTCVMPEWSMRVEEPVTFDLGGPRVAV